MRNPSCKTNSFFFAAVALAALSSSPAWSDSITEFTVPAPATALRAITAGPDGALWFVETTKNKIGRTTTTGTITEFDIPTAASNPTGIALGPDGNLWFTEGAPAANKIGRLTPSGTFTEFPITTAAAGAASIVTGPDNNLWFAEQAANKIGVMKTDGTMVNEYPIPTAASSVYHLNAGPDGNLWFAEQAGAANKVSRITPAGVITEFPVVTAAAVPVFVTAAPDGNVWFSENSANKIGRVTPGGTVTEFAIPTAASFPYQIITGPDGALWFTEFNGNKIGRVTTAGTVTGELVVPTAAAEPFTIALGPDSNLWFTEFTGNKIGKVTVTPPAGPTPLVASILPTSRSVQVGNFATVFATILNSTISPQTQCRITVDPTNYVPGFFSYQTTNPATNALSGTPNTGANISASGLQTYVLAFKAGAPMPPSDVKFTYICDGVLGAAPITGVNTLQLVFDAAPVADMIAVGVTPSGDGFSHTGGNSGTGIFAIATTNIGPTTTLTAKPRLSSVMPVTATVCETNSSAVCKAPPAASVTLSVALNATPTFSVFLQASGAIPPDPATKRVFLEFLDGGSIVRGSTSTAVTTQ